jgi:hypothetical protein
MKRTSNLTTLAAQRYYWQFGTSMALYVAILFASIWTIKHFHLTGGVEVAVVMLPVIPIALVFVAFVRFFQGTDELERQINMESLALAAGLTALLAITYYFLEGIGLPRISMLWPFLSVMLIWGISKRFVSRKYL